MKLQVLNIKGEATGKSVELPDEVFGIEPNQHSVWLDVKRYLLAQRQGTSKSKERSEMSGSTRKLVKQKGTGGARKGDINNPLYRGGGRVFGPRPRNYDIDVNKKVRALARRSALSSAAKAGTLLVVEDFTFSAPKTSQYTQFLQNLKVADKASLMVLSDYDKTLYLSSRNIPNAALMAAKDVSTYDLVRAKSIILSESAVAALAENSL